MIELLLATSALAGLAVGLVGPLWLVVAATVAVAGVAAVITWSHGYGAWGGIAFITGCLIACQLSYLAGRFVAKQYGFPDLSAQNEIDGDPGDPRQRSIAGDDRNKPKPPARSTPPQP